MSHIPLKIRFKLGLALHIQQGELWLVNRWLKWERLKDDESLLALRDELINDLFQLRLLRMKGEYLYAEAKKRGLHI